VFLVTFTMLGFIAGIRIMLRSAKEIQNEENGQSVKDEKEV